MRVNGHKWVFSGFYIPWVKLAGEGGREGGPARFLHIDDFDKKMVERVVEVKAVLKSGERNYQPL
jgi:hypothetical protein